MDVCETCKCDAKDGLVNCHDLNLFRVFDAKEWATVNASELGALKRIE